MHKIYQYIDRCLIDKGITETDQLSEHEFSTFADLLINEDTCAREAVLIGMQKLLDERCREARLNARLELGISFERLSNGDGHFIKRPGY